MSTPYDIATFAKSIKNDVQPGEMLNPHGKVSEEKSDNENHDNSDGLHSAKQQTAVPNTDYLKLPLTGHSPLVVIIQ